MHLADAFIQSDLHCISYIANALLFEVQESRTKRHTQALSPI